MTLKSQIDAPLRRSIALLNLLRIPTLWCCCGYNYKGQVKGKEHMWGKLQILFKRDESNLINIALIMHRLNHPEWQMYCNAEQAILYYNIRTAPEWQNVDSKFFFEMPCQMIMGLENLLLKYNEGNFLPEVVIVDTNSAKSEGNPHWNQHIASPWKVTKEEAFDAKKWRY